MIYYQTKVSCGLYNEIRTDELVVRIQNKSEEAFSVLYKQYSSSLWNVASNITHNDVASDEILQDSFVKIWLNMNQYDPMRGTLYTWMLNITRNTCKDYFRSRNYQISLLKESLTEAHNKYPVESYEKGEQSQELLILTHKLQAKYKEMIELVYIGGYTQDEVSKKLKIPLGTVKTRCNEALRKLRRIYLVYSLFGEKV